MAQGKFCAAPRGGGSASSAIRYILGEEMTAKVSHAERDEGLHASQTAGLGALFAEARERADLGAGKIWSPIAGGGTRPSSVYARGVWSLETAALDIESVSRTQPRVKQAIQHIVISLSEAESATVDDETLIRAAEMAVDRAGFRGHQAVFTTHRDTPNAHCHVAVASVHPHTLRAWERQRGWNRLHEGLRYSEIHHGLQFEHGLAVVRDAGTATQRVEPATKAERQAWAQERGLAAERLEDRARSFLSDSDGLETPEDRRDRIVFALRRMLSQAEERKETPLQADVYVIAAEHAATIERGPEGELRLRLMDRAKPIVGDRVLVSKKPGEAGNREDRKGTLRAIDARMMEVEFDSGRVVSVDVAQVQKIAREALDGVGEPTHRLARWVASDHVFPLDPTAVIPGPLDDGSKGTIAERAAQAEAVRQRSWLSSLGDVAETEREVASVLETDPGRVSRDLVASGSATFTVEDVDRWTCSRISDGGPEWSDYVLREDPTLVARSADTEHPLLTTAQQLELESRVYLRASRLAQTRDPFFDRAALGRAIAAEETALGVRFTPEQRRACDLLEYRFGVVQGDAGTGKSTLMAVQRRYCEMTGREIAGFATSQLAAETLGEKAKIKSVNSARALALEKARGHEMVAENSRAIVDETSMYSLEAADEILERMESRNAGAMFIGDEAQLSNIGAGDTMRVLAAAAQEHGRYAEVRLVYRQQVGSATEWMRTAVSRGTDAIRTSDGPAAKAYFGEYVDRGHVAFHANRKAEIEAKAEDLVAAYKGGVRAIAPGFRHNEALFVNRAVRRALGYEGRGEPFKLERGVRELAPGDRVIFTKNAESKLGVLNGYTGTVANVDRQRVGITLDSGRLVTVEPAKYPHLEWGFAVTTHKAQGQGSPLVIASLTKDDTARSAHVALTRTEAGLRVHTRLTPDELLEHLSSPGALRAKDDALLLEETIRRTGGEDTPWARAVRRALEQDADPLRQEHRAEMRARSEERGAAIVETLERYRPARASAEALENPEQRQKKLATVAARERRDLDRIGERYALESFVVWAIRRREELERESPHADRQADREKERETSHRKQRQDHEERQERKEARQRGQDPGRRRAR